MGSAREAHGKHEPCDCAGDCLVVVFCARYFLPEETGHDVNRHRRGQSAPCAPVLYPAGDGGQGGGRAPAGRGGRHLAWGKPAHPPTLGYFFPAPPTAILLYYAAATFRYF